ncbi:hypothetical protein V7O66_03415 [Methanolobus sp. ZRKC3]|uniref:hypothetical protein n=1 Tax=Methanolobus sp. ZRKC3 TaxID=3125786 RepID=UPI0032492958
MKKTFIFLALFIISISTASAMVYDIFDNPHIIIPYQEDHYLVGTDSTTDDIYDFYSSLDSSSLLINDFTGLVDADMLPDGKLVFAIYPGSGDGIVIACDRPTGILEYPTATESFSTLAIISGAIYSMAVDQDTGDIYVASGKTVYQLTAPSYSSSVLCTIPSEYYRIESLAMHPDGLLIGTKSNNNVPRYATVYLYDGTLNEMYKWSEDGAEPEISAMAATESGDIYFASWQANTAYATTVYTDVEGSTPTRRCIGRVNATSGKASLIGTVSYRVDDIVINDAGIIYCAQSTNDKIITYSTVDLSGGYVVYNAPSDSGDSSSDSNTTSILGDSHEWTNDEIATSSRQIVPPIFFIVLLMFFMYVIGGN